MEIGVDWTSRGDCSPVIVSLARAANICQAASSHDHTWRTAILPRPRRPVVVSHLPAECIRIVVRGAVCRDRRPV